LHLVWQPPEGPLPPTWGGHAPPAWFCGECSTLLTVQTPAPPSSHPRSPPSYTPAHLAEKIFPSPSAPEGERERVTGLFADLKGSMHLAARMEQMAMPSSIFITLGVFTLAEGFVQVDALGPVPINSLSTPLEVNDGLLRDLDGVVKVTCVNAMSRPAGRPLRLG
jgi:hypothetical protein